MFSQMLWSYLFDSEANFLFLAKSLKWRMLNDPFIDASNEGSEVQSDLKRTCGILADTERCHRSLVT